MKIGYLLLLGILAAFLLLAISVFSERRKRAAQIETFAKGRGWTYTRFDRYYHQRFPTAIFRCGSSRRSKDILIGTFQGAQCRSFTYSYKVKSTEYKRLHFHCAAIVLPRPFPLLTLTHERPGSKVASTLGFKDLQFEWQQFNDAWHVQSSDERFAYDIVQQELMALLMQPEFVDFSICLVGGEVVAWWPDRLDLGLVEARLATLLKVLGTIRPYIWTQGYADSPQVLESLFAASDIPQVFKTTGFSRLLRLAIRFSFNKKK